jgi:hypothetical protein
MKLVFEFGYSDVIVLASTKDEQTMIDLLSRATICRKQYKENATIFERTTDTVRVSFAHEGNIVDPIEKVEE